MLDASKCRLALILIFELKVIFYFACGLVMFIQQAFKSPGKAQPVSMLLEAGRSFSPAVMSQTEEDEVDSAFHAEVVREDASRIDDDVFFSFAPDRARKRRGERPGFLPGIEEEKPVTAAVPQVGKDEIEGPPR